jgi:hypothetical protein
LGEIKIGDKLMAICKIFNFHLSSARNVEKRAEFEKYSISNIAKLQRREQQMQAHIWTL